MLRHLLGRMPVAISALLLVTCLFACTQTDQKSAGPAEIVTIANLVPPFTVLVDVAHLQGYYGQEGLAVTMQKYQYGKVALDALLEGRADFAAVAGTPIMLAIMKGEKIAVISTIQTSTKNCAIIARQDKGIYTPQDLKGRKIAATFGTFSEFFMDSFLVVHGISKNDVKVSNLKPDDMSAALINGDVDAVSTWVPALNGMQKNLADRGITFYDEDIYTQSVSIVAKQEYIRDNPGKVRKLLRALIKAEEFSKKNLDEAQKSVAEFNRMDPGMLKEMWAGNTFSVTLDQSLLLALEDESRWAIKHGLTRTTKIPNYLDFIYLDGLSGVKPEAVRILR